jgi:hypothetical protein
MSKSWSEEEITYLQDNAALGANHISTVLGRSYQSVSQKAFQLRLKLGEGGRPMKAVVTLSSHIPVSERYCKLPLMHPVMIGLIPVSRSEFRKVGYKGSTYRWRKIRERILMRDQNTCQYCGQEANTVDHVIPIALGGTDEPNNLVAACARCNYSKGKKESPTVFVQPKVPMTLLGSFYPKNASISHYQDDSE